jgi:hypothetical protein
MGPGEREQYNAGIQQAAQDPSIQRQYDAFKSGQGQRMDPNLVRAIEGLRQMPQQQQPMTQPLPPQQPNPMQSNPMQQPTPMQQAAPQMPMRAPMMPQAPNAQQVRPEAPRMQAMRNMQRMRGYNR